MVVGKAFVAMECAWWAVVASTAAVRAAVASVGERKVAAGLA